MDIVYDDSEVVAVLVDLDQEVVAYSYSYYESMLVATATLSQRDEDAYDEIMTVGTNLPFLTNNDNPDAIWVAAGTFKI